MQKISAQAEGRIVAGVQKFQPILHKARLSGRNESDTVTIIADILCEVFGFDKYENITSEFAIKRTFCDLAVKLGGQVRLLIECKAVGVELREEHIIQATGYAANSGIDWVVLTNGIAWRVYRVIFSKPVDRALVHEFDFCDINTNQPEDVLALNVLSIESFTSSGNQALELLYAQKRVLNRYIVGRLLLNDYMIQTARRSLERHFPSVKITDDELRRIIRDEVFRPEIVDGASADEAAHVVSTANARMKAEQQARKK